METISKLLHKRLEQVKIIADKAAKYTELAKNIISGTNPLEYKNCLEAIQFLNLAVEELPRQIPTGAGVHLLKSCMELYQKLLLVEKNISVLMAVLENQTYTKYTMYNMSSTYVVNVQQEKNLALLAQEKYQDLSISDDEIIFDLVFAGANIMADPDPATMFIIESEAIVNKFTIKLIGTVINIVSGDKRRRLELVVEKQKDILLGSSRMKLGYVGVQNKLIKAGLIPITSSMPPAELFKHLPGGVVFSAKKSLEENLTVLADVNKSGIILLNIATGSPIEFDLRGLIDLKYITENDLKTNPQSGLNKKIIDRFNTARRLPASKSPARAMQHILPSRPAPVPPNYYIIETINGELYRLMGRARVDGNDVAIPADSIRGLIEGLSLRAHNYNLIQSEEILSKCFDSKSQNILSAYAEEKLVVFSSDPIKNTITRELTEWFDNLIRQTPVESMRELKSVATDQKVISDILLRTLVHLTGIHGKGSAEYLITYVAKFDGIVRAFIKELERRWGEERQDDRIFRERSGENLNKYILEMFSLIVQKSVDELDSSKTWTEYDISLKEYFLEHKQAIV